MVTDVDRKDWTTKQTKQALQSTAPTRLVDCSICYNSGLAKEEPLPPNWKRFIPPNSEYVICPDCQEKWREKYT